MSTSDAAPRRWRFKFGIDVLTRLPQSSSTNMVVPFVVVLRGCCVALALLLVTARGAEQNPLIGATRDQVLTRYGEPKSQMTSGNRLIFLYPGERIILRDDVVIEVEQIVDPTRRPPATDTPSTPTTPAPAPQSPPSGTSTPPSQTAPSTSAPPPTQTTPPAPDSKVGIKLVRPPSKDGRPAPVSTPPPTRETVAPKSSPEPTAVQSKSTPVVPVSAPEPTEPPATPADSDVEAKADLARKAAEARKAEELAAAEAKKRKADALRVARRRLEDATMAESTEDIIPARTYILALIVVGAGIGYFVWRYRQRQLELAATSVLNTPLSTPTAAPAGNKGIMFTADQLNKMEWSRFEELVAEYYSKTGVVAVRTKTGPESPVHIKISWKGEPRPFAYVQCVAHPSGLIDAKPVQAFIAALAADDIRRGYVVTTGKFSVPARDVAEEKHITLLPGDIFLEKLNALPLKARSEIMEAIRAGV